MTTTTVLGLLARLLLVRGAHTAHWRPHWPRRRRRDVGEEFVWDADDCDSLTTVLEDAEHVLVSALIAGVLTPDDYQREMCHLADLDARRRPVSVPVLRAT